MTNQEIDQEITRIEPTVSTEERWAYRILLSAKIVGPFQSAEDLENKIAKFWGVKPSTVQTMCRRAWMNKVVLYGPRNQKRFLNGEIYKDGLGIVMGVAILMGLVRRVKK